MDSAQLISRAYEAFAKFVKPLHATNYKHCEECAEYDQLLQPVKNSDLSIEQVGTVCWGPIPFLLPEAMAYYMPRLIELAVTGVPNKEGEPYFTQFINSVCAGPTEYPYSLFGSGERQLVTDALIYLRERYEHEIAENCWENDLELAIQRWAV